VFKALEFVEPFKVVRAPQKTSHRYGFDLNHALSKEERQTVFDIVNYIVTNKVELDEFFQRMHIGAEIIREIGIRQRHRADLRSAGQFYTWEKRA